MIIIATNKENCIKEFESELKRNPDQKTFTIYVDDGLDKSIIINNDYIVKRTYLTNKNNALETLIKAFEILPVDMLYHGITLKFDETKEGKETMKNEKDYYELELSDIIVTDDDMEEFAGEVAKIYKSDIAGFMGMYGIVPGLDYGSAITSASAYGFNYAVDLIMNRLFEKAKKPERYDFIGVPVEKKNPKQYDYIGVPVENKKPNKLTNENKKKLLKMIDCISSDVHPTPEELKNEKITLTYAELEELIQELFSVG